MRILAGELAENMKTLSAKDFIDFEEESEQLANEEAAKVWGEEKIRRKKGLLGVPAADARIGVRNFSKIWR